MAALRLRSLVPTGSRSSYLCLHACNLSSTSWQEQAAQLDLVAKASKIDMALAPPRQLPHSEQLTRLRKDDLQRGSLSPFNLPESMANEGRLPHTCQSWGQYFRARGWDEEAMQDRVLLQTLTGALSCPLTAWASLALFANQIQSLPSRHDGRVHIHIIGAADKNEGSLLQSGWAWDELGEILPSSPRVHLSLIGPELSSSSEIKLAENLSATCHSCDYHSWKQKSSSPPASLALCFNSGLGTDIAM
jgi:hypothetical protein